MTSNVIDIGRAPSRRRRRSRGSAARTHRGRVRASNEDRLLAAQGVYAVADGVGGGRAGDVAATIAVETLEGGLEPPAEADLVATVERANRRIHELGRRDAARAGMATTLTVAVLGSHELALAHVGDSRAYRLRDGRLERLTDDHSLAAADLQAGRFGAGRAAHRPLRSVLTRALGLGPDVAVDSWTYPAVRGDLYLLCSDGLTAMVPEPRLRRILRTHSDLDRAADRLVESALRAGGRDNVTVVLFRVGG